jgi:hypothetical protein
MEAAQEQVDDVQESVSVISIWYFNSSCYCCRELEGIHNSDNMKAEKKGLMDKTRDMRAGILDGILQQHKDTAADHFHCGKQFLSEERRDQFIYCCKNVCCHYTFSNFVKVRSQADHY